MAVKATGQLSLADALVAGFDSGALDRISGLVDWGRFAAVLRAVRAKDGGPGRAAWLIETTSARPRGGKLGPARPGRDTDAGFARRRGKAGSVFGYKAHVGVDEGSGLVRKVIVTAANVNDTVVADGLKHSTL